MPLLPHVKGERVVRALRRAGWEVVRIRGSHYVMAHPDRPGETVVVPVHRRELKRGTLADILQRAGLTDEELKDLL